MSWCRAVVDGVELEVLPAQPAEAPRPHSQPVWSPRRLAEAEAFYASAGFVPVAAPWVVGAAAYGATRPSGAVDVAVPGGFVVASGEQSFVQLLVDGAELGRAQATTPCCRMECCDALHQQWFMKLELVDTTCVDRDGLVAMVDAAVGFFSELLDVSVVSEGAGVDVVCARSGIELGSYGLRGVDVGGDWFSWVYGTGCAEPRLSTVLELAAA